MIARRGVWGLRPSLAEAFHSYACSGTIANAHMPQDSTSVLSVYPVANAHMPRILMLVWPAHRMHAVLTRQVCGLVRARCASMKGDIGLHRCSYNIIRGVQSTSIALLLGFAGFITFALQVPRQGALAARVSAYCFFEERLSGSLIK